MSSCNGYLTKAPLEPNEQVRCLFSPTHTSMKFMQMHKYVFQLDRVRSGTMVIVGGGGKMNLGDRVEPFVRIRRGKTLKLMLFRAKLL